MCQLCIFPPELNKGAEHSGVVKFLLVKYFREITIPVLWIIGVIPHYRFYGPLEPVLKLEVDRNTFSNYLLITEKR